MNYRLWHGFCLYFLIFNLKLLIDDYGLVNYVIVEKGDRLYDDSIRFLVCTGFSNIKKNDEFKNKPKLKLVQAKDFLNYSIMSIEHRLRASNLFRINETFIFHKSICFLATKDQLEDENPLGGFLRYYDTKLFIYQKDRSPIYSEYIYSKRNRDLHFYNLKIKRQKIYNERFLSNQNCLDDKKVDLATQERIKCTNRCFSFNNISFGFYSHLEEKERFGLHFIVNMVHKDNVRLKREIKSFPVVNILENKVHQAFHLCLRKCSEFYCFYENSISLKLIDHKFKSLPNKIIDVQTTIYRAYYSIKDFSLQFVSLVILMTNTSLIDTLPLLLIIVSKKVRFNQHKYFKLFYVKFKAAFVFSCLIFFLARSIDMYRDYDCTLKYPNRTTFLNFTSEMPDIVICLPVEMIIENDSLVVRNRISKLLKRYTFTDLEKLTDFKMQKLIKKIKLLYGGKVKEFDYQVLDKVIFKNSQVLDYNYLSRCYRIRLNFNKLRFENLNPIYFVEISFRNDIWETYVIDKDRDATFTLKELKEGYLISKVTIKNSISSRKSNCIDFKTTSFKCRSKKVCQNQCIVQQYYKEYTSLPAHFVVDKDYIDHLNLSTIKFTSIKNDEIKRKCQEKFDSYNDCRIIRYEESFKTTNSFDYFKKRINLNFEELTIIEMNRSMNKLLLNILNLASVLFGLNAIESLLLVVSAFQKQYRFRWFKFVKLFVFVICLGGFTFHSFIFLKSILKENLIYNEYFEKLDKFSLPNVLICLNLRLQIDLNHKMTGNYLDRIRRVINFESIINKIAYFNKTHVNLFYPTKTDSSNSEIALQTYYFLNFICFEIQVKIIFNEKDFYYTPLKNILEVYLNELAARYISKFYLLYSKPGSKQFSDILEYSFESTKNGSTVYEVDFELIEIEREDKYELVKNPMSLFRKQIDLNDATSYLDEMKAKFKAITNMTTTDTILDRRKDDFNLEINNELFLQFYYQIQNVTDYNQPSSLNTKKSLYNCYSNKFRSASPYFEFDIFSKIRKVIISNDTNYTKCLQTILSTLSLWLSVCVLDLIVYINQLLKFIFKFYKLLIKLEAELVPF